MSLRGEARAQVAGLHRLKELATLMVKTIDDLTTDFQAYRADVESAINDLKAQVDELKAELAAQSGGVPADVQAKLDALDAAVLAADEAVRNPAAPAPAAEPVVSASGSPATDPSAISPNPGVVPAMPAGVLGDTAGDGMVHPDGSVAPHPAAVVGGEVPLAEQAPEAVETVEEPAVVDDGEPAATS